MSSYSDYRSGTSPESRKWNKPPTVIAPPANQPRGRVESSASGSNPYGHSFKAYGNPISARTLTQTGSARLDGPPKKRIKFDHTFTPELGKRARSTQHNNEVPHFYSRSTSNSQVEHNVVDDDGAIIVLSEHEAGPNSDELDCLSTTHEIEQPSSSTPVQSNPLSKYHFSGEKTLSASVVTKELVPDGQNTKWVDEAYGTARDRPVDLSDPIENYDQSSPKKRGGRVKDLVEEFEQRTNPPKIDLAKEMKGKAKMKKKFPRDTEMKRNAIPMKRKIEEHMPSNSRQRELGPFSVKEVIIDQSFRYHPDTAKFRAFYNPDVLTITDGDKEIFKIDFGSYSENLQRKIEYTTDTTPTIQIQIQSNESLQLFTVQFVPTGDKEHDQVESLVLVIRQKFQSHGFIRHSQQLLDVGRHHYTAKDAKQLVTRSSESNPQPAGKSSKPSSVVHNLRYTPPVSEDNHGSGRFSVRQTTQNGRGGSLQTVVPRRSTRNLPPEKPTDQDKVILVYPQGIPGAVNVTNGDLARLQPGEFLNDTLIEFGLKLWLRGLEETQPELASKVHIFNSFFYKKLNNKKNDEVAFATVRKWTSKFDLFQKKYIIVPINEHMHWYLAIIYEPEHILSAIVEDVSPRKRTRQSAKTEKQRTDSPTVAPAIPTDDAQDPRADNSTTSTLSSEAEVERNLDTDFQNSCTIEQHHETKENNVKDASSDLSYISEPLKAAPSAEDKTVDNEGQSRSVSVSELLSDDMDVDASSGVEELDGEAFTSATSGPKTVPSLQDLLQPGRKPSDKAYESAKSRGKRKATSADDVQEVESPDAVNVQSTLTRKTYIFTFDSLGTNHPHAIKKLSQYLRMEAKDKKNNLNAGIAGGKTALVPVQPNFCDCGVYLLHFAQTFVSDPDRYCRLILSQSKSVTNEERQQLWNDKKVGDMREELSQRIQSLSGEWQKERALKEKDAQLQGTSGATVINNVDSDSDIEMPSPVKKGRAARIRG